MKRLHVDVSQSFSRFTSEGAALGNDFVKSKAIPALTPSSTGPESPYIVSSPGSLSSFEDLAEDPYYEENISSLVMQPYTKMDVNLKKYGNAPEDLTRYITCNQSYANSCGGFGNIWKCKLDSITHNGNEMPPQDVAVKVFRVPSRDSEDLEKMITKLRKEAFVWQKLENSHILPLYGTVDGFDVVPALVCPWMEKGSLHQYLKTMWCEELPPPEMHCLFLLLFQVVSGLQYLHSKGVIHGDLMPSNVLINENGKAVLADFGLSRLPADHETSFSASQNSGAIRWAAPEIIPLNTKKPNEDVDKPNKTSDIHSFGCIMMQVLSGCPPYFDMKCETVVVVAKSKRILPTRPTLPAIADDYWRYMEQCWSTNAKMRPSVDDVLDYITAEHDRQKLIS
ncbi:kinase-like protein [Suillus brevipes Sb2]|nr:kinase-like protein [Suillus brevipes Sb2]